jgi:hypothetical protein
MIGSNRLPDLSAIEPNIACGFGRVAPDSRPTREEALRHRRTTTGTDLALGARSP